MKRFAALLLLCCASAEGSDFMPDPAQALIAIDALPMVQAAQARGSEADARGEAFRRNPYGFEVGIAPTVRHENRGTSYGEWEASVSHRLRLPRKADIDRQLGEVGIQAATLGLADARHAGARALLERWFEWLRSGGALRLAIDQQALARAERDSVARRVTAGDLATLDAERADAALAAADAALARARFEHGRARNALDTQFPSLAPLPGSPDVPSPLLSGDADVEAIVDGVVNENHEIAIAEALARRQGLAAARADAERRPDPSVGLRVIDEARGNEQAVALTVSIPFAGPASAPTAMAEQYAADALAADAAEVRRSVHSEALQLATGLGDLLANWQAAERASVANDAALARMEKARALGEASFADVALARRNAVDARAAEWQARVAVHETRTRIEVDSHRLWSRHEDHDH
jgi:cobalt-zinc-cadmium efflux system outer membrane protein